MARASQGCIKRTGDAIGRPFCWFAEALAWRGKSFLQKAGNALTALEIAVRQGIGFNEAEAKLIGDSQIYWNDSSNRSRKQYSHWRGSGIFTDDSRWLELGREHLQLYEQFARAVDMKYMPKRIVEWGCGGGMNAFHFGRLTEEFYGVDISSSSLQECGRQMAAIGLHNFAPVLINAADPEAALGQVRGLCDLFLSTYVFELVPTPEYGIRILRIAYELLAPGGIAIIQIKYSEGSAKTRSRAWAYAKNLGWNATYRIDAFWQAAHQCGFVPKMVTLQPQQPLVNDRNYAYFLLQKQSAKATAPRS